MMRGGVFHGRLGGVGRDERVEVERHVGRRRCCVLLSGLGEEGIFVISHVEHAHVKVVTVGEERAQER
jgi:hypothetical protein